MQEFMNSPVEKKWTEHDVIKDYQLYKDKRKVSQIHVISVAEINKILKMNGVE